MTRSVLTGPRGNLLDAGAADGTPFTLLIDLPNTLRYMILRIILLRYTATINITFPGTVAMDSVYGDEKINTNTKKEDEVFWGWTSLLHGPKKCFLPFKSDMQGTPF